MTQRSIKTIYLIATTLLTLIVLMYIANSIFNEDSFTKRFSSLGYPAYLIFPLSIANMLGLVAIWYRKFEIVKQWAYAGFLFNFLLAFTAELKAADTDALSPVVAITALAVSFLMQRKLAASPLLPS
jgi:hypothetical protein